MATQWKILLVHSIGTFMNKGHMHCFSTKETLRAVDLAPINTTLRRRYAISTQTLLILTDYSSFATRFSQIQAEVAVFQEMASQILTALLLLALSQFSVAVDPTGSNVLQGQRALPMTRANPYATGWWSIKRRMSDDRLKLTGCLDDINPCNQVEDWSKLQLTSVDAGDYVVINDGEVAMGVKNGLSKFGLTTAPLSSAMTNPFFQWKIKQNGPYVRFANRQTGNVLDSTKRMPEDDFVFTSQDVSYFTSQDWQVVPA